MDVTINIIEQIKTPICSAEKDSIIVLEAVKKELENGNNVFLSFEGVDFLVSIFTNLLLGELYLKYGEEEARKRVRIIDLSEDQESIVQHSKKVAKDWAKKQETGKHD